MFNNRPKVRLSHKFLPYSFIAQGNVAAVRGGMNWSLTALNIFGRVALAEGDKGEEVTI